MEIEQIIEKLKSITLLEAIELVNQIEQTFEVKTSIAATALTASETSTNQLESSTEQIGQTEFNVILESVPGEDQKSKRLNLFRLIRELTSLGLKEAKQITTQLPYTLKESISKETAETIIQQLQDAGATAIIQ